jgi:hypothetical protein
MGPFPSTGAAFPSSPHSAAEHPRAVRCTAACVTRGLVCVMVEGEGSTQRGH